MTLKEYLEREKILDEYLYKQNIITENYTYNKGSRILSKVDAIINPIDMSNANKVIPKNDD